MPTDLPERPDDLPKPTNPGTDKVPEDPSEVERKKIIEGDTQSDIPDPVPGEDVPGLGGVPSIL